MSNSLEMIYANTNSSGNNPLFSDLLWNKKGKREFSPEAGLH